MEEAFFSQNTACSSRCPQSVLLRSACVNAEPSRNIISFGALWACGPFKDLFAEMNRFVPAPDMYPWFLVGLNHIRVKSLRSVLREVLVASCWQTLLCTRTSLCTSCPYRSIYVSSLSSAHSAQHRAASYERRRVLRKGRLSDFPQKD